LSDSALVSLVLSYAPSYHSTAARLTSLNDLPVPDTSSSAALISLEPRIQAALQRQEQQQAILADIRHTTVAVLETWYELGVLAMADCWTEWEGRIKDAERHVQQQEATLKRNLDEST